jgi:hypothetical protein
MGPASGSTTGPAPISGFPAEGEGHSTDEEASRPRSRPVNDVKGFEMEQLREAGGLDQDSR